MRVKWFLQGSSPIWIAMVGSALMLVCVANIPGIPVLTRTLLGSLVGSVLATIIFRQRHQVAVREQFDDLKTRREVLEKLHAAVQEREQAAMRAHAAVQEREQAAMRAHAELLDIAERDPIFIICAYRKGEKDIDVVVRQDISLQPEEALNIVGALGTCLERLAANPAAAQAEWN